MPNPFSQLPFPNTFPQADGFPLGVIMAFAGPMTTPFQNNKDVNNSGVWLRPGGWLLCDGTELNIVEYFDLFLVLGTIYGGDGQQTFKLPDYRGYFLRGDGRGTEIDKSLENRKNTQGEDYDGVGSLELDSLEDHTHVYNAIDIKGTQSTQIPIGKEPSFIMQAATESSKASVPGSLIPASGKFTEARNSEETRPVNISVSYIIKACAAGRIHSPDDW